MTYTKYWERDSKNPVNYSYTTKSKEFYFMIRTSRCCGCGHIVVEEPVPGGTMFSCLENDVYEDGSRGCGNRYWFDE